MRPLHFRLGLLRSVTTTTFELRESAFSARIVSACMLKTFNRMSKGNQDLYSNKESRDRFSSIPKCTAHHFNFCRTIWDFLIITRIERGRCNVRSTAMYPGRSKSFRFFKYTVFALLSQINFFYDNLELNLGLNPAEMGLSHLSVPTSSPPGTASNQGCGSGSRCSGQTIEKGISIEFPYSWL